MAPSDELLRLAYKLIERGIEAEKLDYHELKKDKQTILDNVEKIMDLSNKILELNEILTILDMIREENKGIISSSVFVKILPKSLIK